MAQSVDFVNPNRKWEIYGSMGCLALAAGTLFTRNQVVKIIGTTVLSAAALNTVVVFFYTPEDHKHSASDDKCPIRSKNRIIHSIGSGFEPAFLGAFTVVGAIFSLTSRVPLSFLKRKVSLSQFAPVWISSLGLSVLAAESDDRQQKIDIVFHCCFASIVYISIGIIAYRTGVFSKKPS